MSPLFFNVYMDCLSESVCNTQTGCTVGGVMINHLMYADDLVIISPSAATMPTMLTCVGKEAYAMLVPMALLRICQCAPLW